MRAAKIDESQRKLVPFLENHGATFQSTASEGKGCPDGWLGYRGITDPVEFKTPKPPSKRPLKTPRPRKATSTEVAQAKWHAEWRGSPRVILRTEADCLRLLTSMRIRADVFRAFADHLNGAAP